MKQGYQGDLTSQGRVGEVGRGVVIVWLSACRCVCLLESSNHQEVR